jgi:hypothetical protein
MVNEVALGLLFALVGWQVALTYLGFGLGIAITAGWVIGRLKLESWLEPWVLTIHAGAADLPEATPGWADRIRAGLDAVQDIVGRVWYWVIAGIATGALIHGYAPEALLTSIMGRDAWWSVPAAVLVGVPMYSNAAGIIPVVEALLGKGAALIPSSKKRSGPGTTLDIPLGHKDAAFVRSHFDGMEVQINDAPRANEIMVAVAVTDSGRPLPRVGGLTVSEVKGEDGLR